MGDLLPPGQLVLRRVRTTLGRLKEQGNEEDCNHAQREVDVKAPSPSKLIGECAAHKRTGDARNAVHPSKDTDVGRSLSHWDTEDDDKDGPREYTSRTNAGNRTTDD